jgi:hypothetical protein
LASSDFEDLLARLVDRLKHLDEVRLRRIETSARFCTQSLADQVSNIEGRSLQIVPDDGIFVLGDQLAVMGHDLVRTEDATALVTGLATLREFKKQLDGV